MALGIGLMSRELAEYVVCVVGNAQGGVCRGCCRLCERLMYVCRCAGSGRCVGVLIVECVGVRRAICRVIG